MVQWIYSNSVYVHFGGTATAIPPRAGRAARARVHGQLMRCFIGPPAQKPKSAVVTDGYAVYLLDHSLDHQAAPRRREKHMRSTPKPNAADRYWAASVLEAGLRSRPAPVLRPMPTPSGARPKLKPTSSARPTATTSFTKGLIWSF